ncbi:MAG: hypothetical protein GC190_19645 [Alphaproteobacteria bacterium]|nr:hypothetical protein [Alphaproteobacteria bacterium]
MLARLFPERIDNTYRGYQAAIWILVLFLLGKTLASVNAIGANPYWSSRDVLQGVEGFPLDNFGATGAKAALLLYGWWGFSHLMLTVLAVIALVRYRSMIPLIFLLAAIEKIGMQFLAETAQLNGAGGAGAAMPLVVIALLLIGFALSISTPRQLEHRS